MTSHHHTTIIGGGVIGLSLAWELARRGLRVTLLERDRIGRATSWAGTGILPPANFNSATDPIDRLRGLSHKLFPQWTDELGSLTGIDCEFRRCGGWYLADTAGEAAAMVAMTGYWHELGIVCESVPLDVLASRQPALSDWASRTRGASAWWVPDECQIRPPRYLRALEQSCRSAGVELCEHSAVTEIRTTDHRAEALVGDGWRTSDSIVVCGGVWAGQVSPSLQLEQSLIPIRGQMLLLKTDAPVCASVINLGHRYIVCRDDGHTLIGSCEEEVGFQLGTTESMLQSLHAFALSIVPELEFAQQKGAWSGLRPLTFDGFPIIGRVPGTANVFVASGHFRSGLHLSPATAVVLADLITGRPSPLSLDPFRVGKQQSPTLAIIGNASR